MLHFNLRNNLFRIDIRTQQIDLLNRKQRQELFFSTEEALKPDLKRSLK